MTPFVCAGALALGIILLVVKSRLNYLRLPELPARAGTSGYDLSIVIPARNEAANIGRVVSSFPGQAVLVVDVCIRGRDRQDR